MPLATEPEPPAPRKKMIKMSLDKDTVLPCDRMLPEAPIKVNPAFPANVTLSEQSKPAKTHPLRPKNGLQSTHNNQAPPTVPPQQIGKRRYSLGVGFKGLAKRRRRANSDSQPEPVLPSHFLLGGNIFDPLNLNSLLDEDVNRMTNQETPKCSPLPARGGDPVEILVPRDITDPLNLKGGGGEGGEGGGVFLSPLKSRKRHRNRHHGGGGGAGEAGERGKVRGGAEGGGRKEQTPARLFQPRAAVTGSAVPLVSREGSVPPSPLPCELNTSINCRDDIVPPPFFPRRHTHPLASDVNKPRNQGDGRQRRRRRTTSMRSSESITTADIAAAAPQPTRFQTPLVGGAKPSRSGGPQPAGSVPPKKKKDKHRYQYGNHSHYYGYHGFYGDLWEGRVGPSEDPRLRLLKDDWFRDKRVLDIGCGAGHMTLTIARRFGPAHILGVDRDKRLVHAARQNMRHFLSHDLVVQERGAEGERGGKETERKGLMDDKTGVKEREGERQTALMEDKTDKGMDTELTKKKRERKRKGERERDGAALKEESDGGMETEPTKKREGKRDGEREGDGGMEKREEEFQQALSLLSSPSLLSSFPISFRVCRGPLSAPPLLYLHPPTAGFPGNVTFITGDYVSEQETWPGRGQYDVIMCLGVTKWVQLQSGDRGVVRLFKRAYQSLSPGGMFILEAQPWSSYSRSKRTTEPLCRSYRSLQLRPQRFTSYLTCSIGYTSYRLLTQPGNQRPIYLFHKGPAPRK